MIVTVNTDDPPLFNTTLSDEAALLGGVFGFDAAGWGGHAEYKVIAEPTKGWATPGTN